MHAVFDTESLARQKKINQRERQRQVEFDQLQILLANSIFMEKMEKDPTKIYNQLGNGMPTPVLERGLSRLCPSLIFIDHTRDRTKRAAGRIGPNGWQTLVVYESGFMPERSVLKERDELVPDLSYEMENRPLNRKDFPKGELHPEHGWIYPEGTVLPGWKKIKQPWGELIRGWRTVLLRLIHQGVLSPASVESIFGADNTAQWASHTGKQSLPVRW